MLLHTLGFDDCNFQSIFGCFTATVTLVWTCASVPFCEFQSQSLFLPCSAASPQRDALSLRTCGTILKHLWCDKNTGRAGVWRGSTDRENYGGELNANVCVTYLEFGHNWKYEANATFDPGPRINSWQCLFLQIMDMLIMLQLYIYLVPIFYFLCSLG